MVILMMVMYKNYIEKVIVLGMDINGSINSFTELLYNIDYKRYFYSILQENDSIKLECIPQNNELQVRILIGTYTYRNNSEKLVESFLEKFKNLIGLTNYNTSVKDVKVY